MSDVDLYKNRKRKARLAGIGWTIVAFAAWPDMVRRTLFVFGDAAATGRNIVANAQVFRMSMLGDIVTEIAFLLTALILFDLLRYAGKTAARAMLSMVVIAVTMAIFKTGAELAALGFFETGDQAHGMLLIELFQASAVPTSVFFGLWMLPLGYLFFVSGFMPRALGVVLLIGSTGYVIHSIFVIAAPGVSEKAVLLSVAAEVATIVWLLVSGVRRPVRADEPRSTGASAAGAAQ